MNRSFGKKTTEQTFLYIYQDEWQKELLTTYENTTTLMDVTSLIRQQSIVFHFSSSGADPRPSIRGVLG